MEYHSLGSRTRTRFRFDRWYKIKIRVILQDDMYSNTYFYFTNRRVRLDLRVL